jgi:branched-chain amino acid transport system permease protein
MASHRRFIVSTAIVLVLLAALPFATDGFLLHFLTEALILGLFAMSLDLQVGYARMISFGHAGAYAFGAYATALILIHLQWALPWALLGGMFATLAIALPVGWLCTRGTGVAYAMLTLAFAQLGYAVAYKWQGVTGGSDGLPGIKRLAGPFEIEWFASKAGYYYLALATLFICFMLCRAFVRSPVGTAVIGIRESEQRAEALGYNVRAYRIIVFAVSSAFAGLAGALYAGFAGFVSPELFFWTVSGHVLVMTVVGGAGTLIGPILGALAMFSLEHQLSAITKSWGFFLGLIFVVFVIFAPQGIWGLGAKRWRKTAAADQKESA